jgi:Mlc titration factor MtfA (ptsG expression regulator)
MFPLWRRRAESEISPIGDRTWNQVASGHPLLTGFGPTELDRLRSRVDRFLAHKRFTGADRFRIDEAVRLTVAIPASLLTLNLDPAEYQNWRTIIVYPGGFSVRRREHDDAGLVHEWDEARGGEAWDRGPMVLSWEDVAGSAALDGYNVVIHECAHKLDMQNGDANGFPKLHGDMSARDWSRAFEQAYAHLCAEVDAGREDTDLDPYATESPGEFFAVASEAFFEVPDVLAEAYPAVYQQLAKFYRQDPYRRLPGPVLA